MNNETIITIEQICTQINDGEFSLSEHARSRILERGISNSEISQAGQCATIIEDYPDDKYSPSYLLLGYTCTGRALHIQVSRAETKLVRVVTVYEPDKEVWINDSRRR